MNSILADGGMAEWLKAAVLKTVERKLRGFESYSLRHKTSLLSFVGISYPVFCLQNFGEMAESAEGARLLSEYVGKLASRVRIPVSPPVYK